MAKNQIFTVGQKAFIEKDEKLLILINPKWGLDLPGGRLQAGEKDLRESFLRELKEETQLTVKIGEPFTTWLWEKELTHDTFLVGYICQYLSGELKLSKEHSEYYWVTKQNYRKVLEKYWTDSDTIFGAIDTYFSTR